MRQKLFALAVIILAAGWMVAPARASSSLDSNVMPAGGLDSNSMPSSGLSSSSAPAATLDSNDMPKRGIDSNHMPARGIDSTSSGSVDPRLCRALVKHTPSADTAYQPGVDQHGRPVASADVPGSAAMALPDKIQIPLTVSLAKTLNLNTSQYPYNQLGTGTEAVIGTLTVEGDQAYLNGQPLSDAQQSNLAVVCMKPN